jgi:hypothetical protein
MYQLEVKAQLVSSRFHAKDGWHVTVHVDPMEIAKGGAHPEGKREIAQRCLTVLEKAGASIGAHPTHGRIDIVAERSGEVCYFIEVEGESSRQREQAMYSALGQLVVAMNVASDVRRYALAVPDSPEWAAQVAKVPRRILELLNLEIFLVSERGVLARGPISSEAG